MRSDRPPFFSADLVISLDADGRPALGLSITVPYQELSWIRPNDVPPGGRLAAGAEFTVVFEPNQPRPLSGDVWERRVVAPGYSATRSPSAVIVEKRTFGVAPGRYELRVAVRDLNAGTESTVRQKVDVPDYSKVPIGFADLELGTADSAGHFTPVPTRVFGLDASSIAARAVLFDRRPGNWPRRYPLQYRVLDDVGDALVSGTSEVTLERSAEPIVVRPNATELFLGHYVFEVELSEGKNHWRVERSFDVDESGPPRGREFERMLEPLSYIATSQEIEHLRGLSPEEQPRGWEEFWRRRDPTPDTPRNEALIEFFRRVRHAEKQFQGFGPGWRSDMGRIYIKYGPPDQIETRAQSATMPQLEIWYYNQPYRRFVFSDREGFGRYILVSPGGE
jgi:GWxTD domain-containing protein